MAETENYYRRRVEEELAAAEQSPNPSISQIHRDMAQRYRELADGASAEPRDAAHWPKAPAPTPETQTAFG